MGERIRIAIAGVGNCASALAQGIHFCRERRDPESIGPMHREIGAPRHFDPERLEFAHFAGEVVQRCGVGGLTRRADAVGR